jgi:hypothetical protein
MCSANWGKLQACGNIPCNSTKLSMPAILRQWGRTPDGGFRWPLLPLSAGNVSSRALQKIQIHYLHFTLGLFNTLGLVLILTLFNTFCQDAKNSTTLTLKNCYTRTNCNIKMNVCSTAFASVFAYGLIRNSISISAYITSNNSFNQWIINYKGMEESGHEVLPHRWLQVLLYYL